MHMHMHRHKNKCTHRHVHTNACTLAYIHNTRAHIQTHMHTHARTPKHEHMCTYTHKHTCTHRQRNKLKYEQTPLCTPSYPHTHLQYACTDAHKCTSTCMHACRHTHAHAHTHTRLRTDKKVNNDTHEVRNTHTRMQTRICRHIYTHKHTDTNRAWYVYEPLYNLSIVTGLVHLVVMIPLATSVRLVEHVRLIIINFAWLIKTICSSSKVHKFETLQLV